MKRFFTKLGMVMTMLLSFLSVLAYDFEVDGIYYEIVSFSEFTCNVVNGDVEYQGDIVIPEKISYANKELEVIGIGDKAFYENQGLQSVKIGDSVRTIGDYAFYGCKNLKSVSMGSSVRTIGGYAFCECENLKSVSMGSSIETIGSYAFSRCALTDMDIPNSVKEIGECAFQGTSLTSIEIPNLIEAINFYTFAGCKFLTDVKLPDSLKTIGSGAFSGCTALKSIEIPEKVSYIYPKCFKGCSSLISINIPESVTEIGTSAFSECTSLKSIRIPNSVTYIGECLFENCTSLESVHLSNNITKLDCGTFNGCENLQRLMIPGNVESFVMYSSFIGGDGDYLFGKCNNLREIELCYGPSKLTGKIHFSNGDIERDGALQFASYLKLSSNTIKEITYLPIEKFIIDRETASKFKLPYLKHYVIGEHMEKIDFNFSESKDLESITCFAQTPPQLYGYVSNSQYMNVIVKVPAEYLEAYQKADGWKNFWNLQGDPSLSGVNEIEADASGKIEVGKYNLNGQRINDDYKGIVVVRYSDGSAEKVIQR